MPRPISKLLLLPPSRQSDLARLAVDLVDRVRVARRHDEVAVAVELDRVEVPRVVDLAALLRRRPVGLAERDRAERVPLEQHARPSRRRSPGPRCPRPARRAARRASSGPTARRRSSSISAVPAGVSFELVGVHHVAVAGADGRHGPVARVDDPARRRRRGRAASGPATTSAPARRGRSARGSRTPARRPVAGGTRRARRSRRGSSGPAASRRAWARRRRCRARPASDAVSTADRRRTQVRAASANVRHAAGPRAAWPCRSGGDGAALRRAITNELLSPSAPATPHAGVDRDALAVRERRVRRRTPRRRRRDARSSGPLCWPLREPVISTCSSSSGAAPRTTTPVSTDAASVVGPGKTLIVRSSPPSRDTNTTRRPMATRPATAATGTRALLRRVVGAVVVTVVTCTRPGRLSAATSALLAPGEVRPERQVELGHERAAAPRRPGRARCAATPRGPARAAPASRSTGPAGEPLGHAPRVPSGSRAAAARDEPRLRLARRLARSRRGANVAVAHAEELERAPVLADAGRGGSARTGARGSARGRRSGAAARAGRRSCGGRRRRSCRAARPRRARAQPLA